MSKFFNETSKARHIPLNDSKSRSVELEDILSEAFAGPNPSIAPEVTTFDERRKISIPLTNLLQAKFFGSDSVESVLESYRALRTRLLKLSAESHIQSVIVTSAAQGEGKTFTSLNLASCCAQLKDLQVLLVDGDTRSSGLTRELGSTAELGLAQILAGQCEAEEAILSTDIPNLKVLPSGKAAMPSAELFATKRWQEFITWCNGSFKFVIVDAPPALNLADVELMSAVCDGVLMVVRSMETKRELLQKSCSQIDPQKRLGVVYNAVDYIAHRYRYPDA